MAFKRSTVRSRSAPYLPRTFGSGQFFVRDWSLRSRSRSAPSSPRCFAPGRFFCLLPCLALAVLVAAGCSTRAEKCDQAFSKSTSLRPDSYFSDCLAGCDQEGHPFSCQVTSWCYRDGNCPGHTAPPDYETALRYQRRACELETATYPPGAAPDNLSSCAEIHHTACLVDPDNCERTCDGGEAGDCLWLARMFHRGFGNVKPDSGRAMALYRRACDLGDLCSEGYAQACESGRPNACIASCDQGNASACYWTAALFRQGDSSARVLMDPDRARHTLRQACQLDPGISMRCASLGQVEAQDPPGP